MTERIVFGVTLTLFSSPHPELVRRLEESGRVTLWNRYMVPRRNQKWVHEEHSVWWDEESQEQWEMPERWMLLTEGWVDE